MKKQTINRILYITIILAVLGFFILKLFNINILTKDGAMKIPSLLSGVVLFWGFYFSIGWKLPILKYLVYKENINGTWLGHYSSKNFTSNDVFQGEIAVVIRQNFLSLNVKSFTENYINYSFAEVLNYDSKSDTHQLIYLYSQSQFNPTDDNIRKGTSELNLHCNIKSKELFGDFWTNHNSKGDLKLKKITTKYTKSFLEAKKIK